MQTCIAFAIKQSAYLFRRKDASFRTAVQLGLALGVGVAGLFLPGGSDAWDVFFTERIQTVLPWVHVLFKPVALLGWPLSYAVLCALTAFTIGFIADRMHAPVLGVLFSAPFIWEIWSGQVDWLGVLGIYLAISILEKNFHPVWLGLAWVLIAIKPWGFGFLAVSVVLAVRQYGLPRILPSGLITFLIWTLPCLLWPADTLPHLLRLIYTNSQSLSIDSWNGAIWPWGLFSWLFLIGSRDRHTLLCRAVAASLLSSPYLRLYHTLAVIVLVDNLTLSALMLIVGWGTVLSALIGLPWRTFAWFVPALYLFLDQARALRFRFPVLETIERYLKI